MTKVCERIDSICNWKIFTIVLLCGFALDSVKTIEINIPGLGNIEGSVTKSAWTQREIYQFLGVPFAESPSGSLRFKAPVPRKKWTGTLNATKYGRRCPVKGLYFPDLKEDIEDCLNLCIYTKNFSAKNPVMVYVHGGGFYNGSASQFKPDFLLEKDIVLVIPQYRLGVLGFLSTNTTQIPGNMAALDIISSLEWVQTYISHFGGDVNRVTLFGQSAGAALVGTLMISPSVPPTGLFHRTIIQSGSIIAHWGAQHYSIHTAKFVCRRAGCSDCSKVEKINKCLIKLDVFKLLNVSTSDSLKTKDKYGLTVGDYNNILPKLPYELMEKGTQYPMMTGVTKQDGSFILAVVYDELKKQVGNFNKMNPRIFIQEIVRASGESDRAGTIANMATKFLFNDNVLKARDYKSMIPGFMDLASTIITKSPTFSLAMLNSRNNLNSTYLYTFDYEGQHTYYGYGDDTDHYPFNGGVHHSDDYIYLFATFGLNNNDTKIAQKMVDIWTSFAGKGNPECLKCPKWTPFNETGPYLHINADNTIGSDFSDEFLATIHDKSQNIIRKDKDF